MSGLGWMHGRDLPLVSITFARDLTPRELLDRMGVDEETVAPRDEAEFAEEFGDFLYEDDAYVVKAGSHGPWAWAWECASWLCVEDDGLLGRVSAGTTALVLHVNEKPLVDFRYAEDGQVVTGLHTLLGLRPEHRTGLDPHRFDAAMRELGADPDAGETGPLGMRGLFYRLAEGLGAGIREADLLDGRGGTLSGQLLGAQD